MAHHRHYELIKAFESAHFTRRPQGRVCRRGGKVDTRWRPLRTSTHLFSCDNELFNAVSIKPLVLLFLCSRCRIAWRIQSAVSR